LPSPQRRVYDMANFLDKLKKGMDINELPEEIGSEEIKEEKPKTAPKKRKKKEILNNQDDEQIEKKPEPTAISTAKKIEIKTEKFEIKKELPPTDNNWLEEEGQLTIDVYQTDKEIVIQSAIAGVRPEDLDILIENDIVLIKGCRSKPFGEEDRNYFYQECHWGRFGREIVMPEEVDNLQAKAGLNQGILTIRLPKTGRKNKKKLLIEEN